MRILMTAAAALAVAGVGLAQQTQIQTTAPAQAKGQLTDRQFVAKAASGGLQEVTLGNEAVRRAASDEVKKFGQQMVTDHTKANEELKQIAARENIPVPQEMLQKHQDAAMALLQLEGAAFDRAYMRQQVRAHMMTIGLFERASQQVQSEALKAFAAKTLPTLRHHLEMARAIAGPGRGDTPDADTQPQPRRKVQPGQSGQPGQTGQPVVTDQPEAATKEAERP